MVQVNVLNVMAHLSARGVTVRATFTRQAESGNTRRAMSVAVQVHVKSATYLSDHIRPVAVRQASAMDLNR